VYLRTSYFSASFLGIKIARINQVSWHMPIVLELRRCRKKNCKSEASLGYIAKPYLISHLKNSKKEWVNLCIIPVSIS
jgi:hypothetical protein